MIADLNEWDNSPKGCNRCGARARHYIPPYYAQNKRICPLCVEELNRIFDTHGWPEEGRLDR